jgi:hypothetical protein
MSPSFRITAIDDLTRQKHTLLEEDDVCLYFGEYTAGSGFGHSPMNNLIYNLKKCVSKRGTPGYQYKDNAIRDVANQLAALSAIEQYVFVPIPPSKSKTNPLYDSRILDILVEAKKNNPEIKYAELVLQSGNMNASHDTATPRSTVDELTHAYQLQNIPLPSQNFIIFDDVLTKGSHFKAMQKVIKSAFPESYIIGMFIARTEHPEIDFGEINWDFVIS